MYMRRDEIISILSEELMRMDVEDWSPSRTHRLLDGTDYGRGELEEIAATGDKIRSALITLVIKLTQKGILSVSDAADVLDP